MAKCIYKQTINAWTSRFLHDQLEKKERNGYQKTKGKKKKKTRKGMLLQYNMKHTNDYLKSKDNCPLFFE